LASSRRTIGSSTALKTIPSSEKLDECGLFKDLFDSTPKATKKVPPTYPDEAKRAGVQGVVRMECLIREDGAVENVHVLSGPEPLRDAAMHALKQWRHHPAIRQGQPVPFALIFSDTFRMRWVHVASNYAMGRVLRAGVIALAAYAAVLGAGTLWARAVPKDRLCPNSSSLVVVDTAARVLCLCRDGHEAGRFRVALGRGGLGKRLELDGKTPLGRYPLGAAIHSSRFYLFLPVGYPTPEQRARGYSGSAIGVHGPHLGFVWLGHWTALLDWTQGCIAVGTQGEVEKIARWVATRPGVEIVLV
jgi:TonB family protein